MRDADETMQREAPSHRVGENLDTLSIEELGTRIAQLAAEIERIEAAREVKKAALDHAGSIFRS